MTETEQETADTPAEPVEAPETAEPDETEQEQQEQPAQPQEPAQEPSGALTKEQQDEIYARMAKRADNYFKSVKEMLDGVQVPLTPCELCGDAYPGLRWLQLEPESLDRVRAGIFGTPPVGELQQDPFTRRCSRCDGWGAVQTNSRVYGQEARICKACNGSGYEALNETTGEMTAPTAPNGETEPAALPGVNPNDPEIARLIAEGYTVVPPLRPIATMETS